MLIILQLTRKDTIVTSLTIDLHVDLLGHLRKLQTYHQENSPSTSVSSVPNILSLIEPRPSMFHETSPFKITSVPIIKKKTFNSYKRSQSNPISSYNILAI